MQSKIAYSPRALKDLDEIWDYIEVELCNLSAAQNTVNGIMDTGSQPFLNLEQSWNLKKDWIVDIAMLCSKTILLFIA